MWEEFTQWLINQNIATVKDFKRECEWKWLVNNHSERLRIKKNDHAHKVYEK